MAEDNPFLGFFESMGVGMEAGAERRSMMERARQGKLEPGEEVPGLGRTILKGITRAATPASTRLAQDQLKLQDANYALQRKAAEDRQAAIDAQNYYKNSLEANEAEAELQDSLVYTEAINTMNQLLVAGDINSLNKFQIPSDVSQSTAGKIFSAKNDFLTSARGTRLFEMDNMREALSRHVPPDLIPNTYPGMKDLLDRITGVKEQEIAKEVIKTGVSFLETTPLATGVNINYPGGQLFLSNKKDEATAEFKGLSDAELQRRFLGIATTNLGNLDENQKQDLKNNEQWLRQEATRRGISLPEPTPPTSSKSLLDQYRDRKSRN
jgi:hypothetical protein